jgi:hypothetical protein
MHWWLALDHDRDTFRFQHVLDAVRNLRVHLLLHLETARIGIDHARSFEMPTTFVFGEIADMHAPMIGAR